MLKYKIYHELSWYTYFQGKFQIFGQANGNPLEQFFYYFVIFKENSVLLD